MPWIPKISRSKGTEYYFNTDTNEKTWDLPYELGGPIIDPKSHLYQQPVGAAAGTVDVESLQRGAIHNQQYQNFQLQTGKLQITSQKIKEELLSTLDVVKNNEENANKMMTILEKEVVTMEEENNTWSDNMRNKLLSQSQHINELTIQKNKLVVDMEMLTKSIENELPYGYGGYNKKKRKMQNK